MPTTEAALSIEQLQKTYPNGFCALSGLDLRVESGDFLALLGPNGAGKSTTLGIVSSLIKKTAGKVSIFGRDIDTHFSQAKLQLGLVPQEFNFHVFEKVEDIVINQGGYFGLSARIARQRCHQLLKQLDLFEKRQVQARMLSGGMKRRLMIARALIHNPALLVLDEPTAGVDIELRRGLWQFLKDINQQGTSLILTTHYLEEAEQLCRTVAIINQGRIIENTSTKDLLKRLNQEVFILDVDQLPGSLPEAPGMLFKAIDAHTVEVTVQKGQALNGIFSLLSDRQVAVSSLRNKANRLEELFVHLVKNNSL
jgi:ABC-2 type transport system ATP-binding protein